MYYFHKKKMIKIRRGVEVDEKVRHILILNRHRNVETNNIRILYDFLINIGKSTQTHWNKVKNLSLRRLFSSLIRFMIRCTITMTNCMMSFFHIYELKRKNLLLGERILFDVF